MAQYHQGKYTVVNKQKYVGDVTNVVYRSSWELKLMIWLDNNENVINWGSEEIVIPYISPIDDRQHRYYPDFAMVYKNRDGKIKKALIEVKPEYQTLPPIQKARKTKRFIQESLEYAKNNAKWAYAKRWCSEKGIDFVILTEKHLGIKK